MALKTCEQYKESLREMQLNVYKVKTGAGYRRWTAWIIDTAD